MIWLNFRRRGIGMSGKMVGEKFVGYSIFKGKLENFG